MLSVASSTSDVSPPAAPATAPGWFIVTQVKSNRIVYFTDDPEYQPTMAGNWYFVTHFLGDLPAEMTLRNCWSWRFNGNVFKDAREPEPKSPLETLLASNRRALLDLLRDKINQSRTALAPTCQLGSEVRRQKVIEARNFQTRLATDHMPSQDDPAVTEPDEFSLLRAVAAARDITMHEAAQLIEARERDTQRLLATTEHTREHYTQAIQRARTQEELIQLRCELLDEVLPGLSKKMAYPSTHFEPEDWKKPLSDIQRQHEIIRLQVQLRELINRRRAKVQTQYLQEDTLFKLKARLAQTLLNNDGQKSVGADFSLLENYAQARNLSLLDAARLILGSMQEAEQVLMRTEMIKDTMQARIETIGNLLDIRAISMELEALAKTGRLPGDAVAVAA